MQRISTVLIAFLCSAFAASAQYYDITHRQTEEEKQQYKREKVQMVTISYQEGQIETPYSIAHYDTGGRMILIASPKHHEHFTYDDNGRLSYWLDSANDGRRFEKFEYHFGYGADNKVNSYRTNQTVSAFSNGTEEVKKGGIVIEKHTYEYTPEGKLALELYKDTAGKVLYMHKLMYNKYGDLSSEIIVNGLKRCYGDSTTVINTYDSKARIIQKQKTITTSTCDLRVPNGPVNKKMVNETITYSYNLKGQLTTENLTASDPTLSNKKEYLYNDEGMITKELNYNSQSKQNRNLVYRYYYFKKK